MENIYSGFGSLALPCADSTRKCNRWVDSGKELIWSLEAKTFPWPVVEPVHDAADLRVCEGVEIGALGQVLTDEPVGVLVESALPGMAGVGEVALGIESLGDSLMVGELLAVVIGERVNKVGMRLQCCEQGVRDGLG